MSQHVVPHSDGRVLLWPFAMANIGRVLRCAIEGIVAMIDRALEDRIVPRHVQLRRVNIELGATVEVVEHIDELQLLVQIAVRSQ